MRARVITAAVLAIGCATLSACTSPAYPYAAPQERAARRSPSPPRVRQPRSWASTTMTSPSPTNSLRSSRRRSACSRRRHVLQRLAHAVQDPIRRQRPEERCGPFVEMQPFGHRIMQRSSREDLTFTCENMQRKCTSTAAGADRFAHEMNGNWYPWGATHTSPKVFRKAGGMS